MSDIFLVKKFGPTSSKLIFFKKEKFRPTLSGPCRPAGQALMHTSNVLLVNLLKIGPTWIRYEKIVINYDF